MSADPVPFVDTVSSVEELRTIYREPHPLVVAKARPTIDEATAAFLANSTFAVIGTCDGAGTLDVSPRGGPPGFLRVLDDRRLAIPDFPGNNRLDCLRNVVETGRIALLAVVTGQAETVRVNGRAWVTTDPELLAGFPPEQRAPRAAIAIEIDETFMHCAKAFRRGGVWEPAMWRAALGPDGAAILACQALLPPDVTAAQIRADLDHGYDAALADERAPS